MSLAFTYTLIAPFYDFFIKNTFKSARSKNIQAMGDVTHKKILVVGIGTGLDIPLLPQNAIYHGIDITPAMLKKAQNRAEKSNLTIQLEVADATSLRFHDETFDIIIMHLILAVVPDHSKTLNEACRVLKSDGKILVFDKFLKRNQPAFFLKMFNPIISRIATSTDVIFEDVLETTPLLTVIDDQKENLNGWFRRIILKKVDSAPNKSIFPKS